MAAGEPRDAAARLAAMSSPAEPPTALVDLVRGCARGRESAFAELYDRTSSRIHGLVLSVVRSPELAAEVTQEVYLQVWRQAARHDPEQGSVLAWLCTLAHRRAVDRVRSVSSERERDAGWSRREPTVTSDEAFEGAARSLDAERVHQALGSLTEIQREALSLAYFGGYSQSEVAGLLELPLGTVKTRIRDGLIRLRDELGVMR